MQTAGGQTDRARRSLEANEIAVGLLEEVVVPSIRRQTEDTVCSIGRRVSVPLGCLVCGLSSVCRVCRGALVCWSVCLSVCG